MATVALGNQNVTITLTSDAADALMAALQHLTFEGDSAIQDEFESTWYGIVDEFAPTDPSQSERFAFFPLRSGGLSKHNC